MPEVIEISATASETESEPDISNDIKPSINRTATPKDKGKRKAGERLVWSEDEAPDAAYEEFKNRAAVKRKKTAELKKRARSKKNAVIGKREPGQFGPSRPPQNDWGDESDYGMLEDSLPDYLQNRRKEFDRKANNKTLKKAGLKLPPDYTDIYFSDDERLESLKERPKFPREVVPSREYKDIKLMYSGGIIPASIAQYLRDYQVDGVAFLHELFVYQKGGILGDDMGLGKTVQVAAFLAAAFGKTGDERDGKRMRKMRRAGDDRWYPRVIVICPGSLLENWKQELDRWGYWHAEVFHGSGKEEVFRSAQAGRLEILLTTYDTYKLNKSMLNLVPWDCVVADECHKLKERTSETTKSMNEINALCRIGLTGTAIQNRYEELWTLLNWTNPGRFGPMSTWKSSIVTPLTMGQSHDATMHQLAIARKTAKKLSENLLPQFFLRRMKSLIAHQLPKKKDLVVFCPLTELQTEAYQRFLASDIVEAIKRSGEYCDCGSKKKRGWCCYKYVGSTAWQALVFPVISNLQKLSNHLALLIPNMEDPAEKQERELTFLQTMVPGRWEDLYQNRNALHMLSNPEFCGKWRVLKKLLRFWHTNGDKVLVFSHSVKLLKMLQHLFAHTSYNVSFLSGSISSYEERQRTVNDFNADPGQFVFLISTKAGGVGLNITSANKVVIFDPNWNPSYDLQAQDRAYRIGQIRDVEVFRLVSAGSVEEIVYARQIYKQQQANIGYNASEERRYFKGVQNQKGHSGEIFGLSNLLSFHEDEVVLRDIVNKTNVAEAKAGVGLVDVDMDSQLDTDGLPLDDLPANEDAGLSQFVDEILEDAEVEAGKKNKKKKGKTKEGNAISAILASAGVEYTHENSEVIGSSRVEAKLSRRAEVAALNDPEAETRLFNDSEDDDLDNGFSQAVSFSSTGTDGGARNVRYQFHPPRDVARRQFCTMAKMWGFASAVEFGLVVESWTSEQRRNALERFYKERREYFEAKEREKRNEEKRRAVEEMKRQREEEAAQKMRERAQDGTKDAVMADAVTKPSKADLVDTEDDEDDEL